MYLKDCTMVFYKTQTSGCESRHYPFSIDYGRHYGLINSIGKQVSNIDKYNPFLIDFKGTPISDREYRLAISRAKSLANQKQ